jgi:hypothetical protein
LGDRLADFRFAHFIGEVEDYIFIGKSYAHIFISNKKAPLREPEFVCYNLGVRNTRLGQVRRLVLGCQ